MLGSSVARITNELPGGFREHQEHNQRKGHDRQPFCPSDPSNPGPNPPNEHERNQASPENVDQSSPPWPSGRALFADQHSGQELLMEGGRKPIKINMSDSRGRLEESATTTRLKREPQLISM